MAKQTPDEKREAQDPLLLPPLDGMPIASSHWVRRTTSIAVITLVSAGAAATVIAATVEVDSSVPAQGVLVARERVAVRMPEAGQVADVLIDPGEQVRRGQVILRIRNPQLVAQRLMLRERLVRARTELRAMRARHPLQLQQQRERRAAAEARLEAAKAALLERLSQFGIKASIDVLIREHKSGGHVGLDAAVSDVRRAIAERRESEIGQEIAEADRLSVERDSASVVGIESELAVLEARIASFDVVAPASGTLISRDWESQRTVTVPTGELIAEVQGDANWDALLDVSERDVLRVSIGARVSVRLEAAGRDANQWIGQVTEFEAPELRAEDSFLQATTAPRGGRTSSHRVRVELAVPANGDVRFAPRSGFAVAARISLGRRRILSIIIDKLLGTTSA